MSEIVAEPVNLKTLAGIGNAREDLYRKLVSGEIPETRANIAERILRGQQSLKGDLPIRFVRMVSTYKGGKLEGYIAGTIAEIADFIEGGDKKALAG